MTKIFISLWFLIYLTPWPPAHQRNPTRKVMGLQLFEPGNISDEYGNRDMTLSLDGKELFYSLQYRSGFVFSTIMHSRLIHGKWSKPAVAEFSGQFNDLEPAFSPDGKKLYFSSNRPLKGNTKKDFDIWYIEKSDHGWSQPLPMPSPVNTVKNEFYPSISRSGHIYFTREMEGKDEDIVVCKWNGRAYQEAESLSDSINTDGSEFNAFVDPDEDFIIYTGYKRKDNIGAGDLYISYKTGNDWGRSINLGKQINDEGITYCPYISPDKKLFFFSSNRGIFKTPFDRKMNFDQLKIKMHSPLNGWDNIYCIQADQILKHK